MNGPTGLTVLDFEAILAQAVDPDAVYKIDGWILIAMAKELFDLRTRSTKPRRQPRAKKTLPSQMSLSFPEVTT